MANSTCVKCGGGSFEVKEAQVQGVQRSMSFVQCASCGVVGALPAQDTNELIGKLAKQLGVRV